jgi:hypothetical protein
LVYLGNQAFDDLDVVCGTVAEGPEIGACGLGVRTRVS